jgi:hypothetical protein
MKYPLKLLAFLPVLALMPASAALADGFVPPDHQPPQVTPCQGGAQEAINGLTRNFLVGIPPGAPAPIQNTVINGGASVGPGPTSADDLYVVTFSAEADNSAAGGGQTVQAEFSVNGGATWAAMPPVGPNTFHQGALQETNTMTWCRRILSPNPVLFRIVSQAFGGVALYDDYATLVERSD